MSPVQKQLLSSDGSPLELSDPPISFTAWDVWRVNGGRELTLQQLVDHFKARYKLLVWSVFYAGIQLVDGAGRLELEGTKGGALKAAQQELAPLLPARLLDLIEQGCGVQLHNTDSVDLNVSFRAAIGADGVAVKEVPKVRLGFSDANVLLGLQERCAELEAQMAGGTQMAAQRAVGKLELTIDPRCAQTLPVLSVLYETGLIQHTTVTTPHASTPDGEIQLLDGATTATLQIARRWPPCMSLLSKLLVFR